MIPSAGSTGTGGTSITWLVSRLISIIVGRFGEQAASAGLRSLTVLVTTEGLRNICSTAEDAQYSVQCIRTPFQRMQWSLWPKNKGPFSNSAHLIRQLNYNSFS